jgi:tRNA pseudouridine-54 N-methylase
VVNFLLLVNCLEKYTKQDINKGKTPKSVYTICCAIRETFCLSYNIRKENTLFVYFEDNRILLKLLGRKLRYLGPDERSQAILINKALQLIHKKTNKKDSGWIPSTPGFYIRKFPSHENFHGYFETIASESPFLVLQKSHKGIFDESLETKDLKTLKEYDSPFFIIIYGDPKAHFFFLQDLYKALPCLNFIRLPNIPFCFEKILFLNYVIDNKL